MVILALLVAHTAVAGWLVMRLLESEAEPFAMAFWLLTLTVLPGLGAALFLLFDEGRLTRRARRRSAHSSSESKNVHRARVDACGPPHLPEGLNRIAHTVTALEGAPVTRGNAVDVADDTDAVHRELIRHVREARHHLHLEYYIWSPDDTGRELLEAVTACARRGVECRILLDAAGSWDMARSVLAPAREAGVQVAFFMPLRPFSRRIGLHLRNHRKIVVVDGQIALCGSQNVANISRGDNLDHEMRQVHLTFRGPAVGALQEIFLNDWETATGEQVAGAHYYPVPDCAGDTPVQVVATGPDQPHHTIERILMEALGQAREEVWMATPYFVPSETLRLALAQAALRGVRTNLILPARYDKTIVHWAARSYYRALVAEGVNIFEYSPGMVHAKLLSIDERWCMVGTANFDMRSFRLNFEVSSLLYDESLARRIAEICRDYRQQAEKIVLKDIENWSRSRRLRAGLARVLGPQL